MERIKFNQKELEKQCLAYAKAYGSAYVAKAMEMIETQAHKYIEMFYSQAIFKSKSGGLSSIPKLYDRTGDLRDNSIKTSVLQVHGNIEGRIIISADKMKNYISGGHITPPYYVANRAWMEGLHGNVCTSPGVMSPTPAKLLDTYIKGNSFNSAATAYAVKMANAGNYGLLNASSIKGFAPNIGSI